MAPLLAPSAEGSNGAGISGARVLVADVGGDELDKSDGCPVARMNDD